MYMAQSVDFMWQSNSADFTGTCSSRLCKADLVCTSDPLAAWDTQVLLKQIERKWDMGSSERDPPQPLQVAPCSLGGGAPAISDPHKQWVPRPEDANLSSPLG